MREPECSRRFLRAEPGEVMQINPSRPLRVQWVVLRPLRPFRGAGVALPSRLWLAAIAVLLLSCRGSRVSPSPKVALLDDQAAHGHLILSDFTVAFSTSSRLRSTGSNSPERNADSWSVTCVDSGRDALP